MAFFKDIEINDKKLFILPLILRKKVEIRVGSHHLFFLAIHAKKFLVVMFWSIGG